MLSVIPRTTTKELSLRVYLWHVCKEFERWQGVARPKLNADSTITWARILDCLMSRRKAAPVFVSFCF